LLAFTIALALNHYEKRLELVVGEANALGTGHLRTGILDQPEPLRSAMRFYTQLRLAYGHQWGPAAAETAGNLLNGVKPNTDSFRGDWTQPSGRPTVAQSRGQPLGI